MNWLKRFFSIFRKKRPYEKYDMMRENLAIKDSLSIRTKKLMDQTDLLNERFKAIMAASDVPGLAELKNHFEILNKEVLDTRHAINKNIQRINLLPDQDHPSMPEALDEYAEMIKALNICIKHHKAVQHMTIKEKISKPDSDTDKFPKVVPTVKRPASTALENMQSQQTVFIKVTEDMLKPPEEDVESSETDDFESSDEEKTS
jgi:hypothetical protein